MTNLEIAEIAARSGANCGSLFLDLRFKELVKTVNNYLLFLCLLADAILNSSLPITPHIATLLRLPTLVGVLLVTVSSFDGGFI